ncbi:MAG TPA: glycoside hydrolase family 44 protein, partial [Polyangiaceae bacterium]|nr:glycoside hydrolase family 44 protein [Polyangiaceae bacterium]
MLKRKWLRLIALTLVFAAALGGGRMALKKLRKHRQAGAESEVAGLPKHPRSKDIALAVYDGKLADGWQDWGWGPHELPSSGPAKIQFRGFGGIILQHETLTAHYGGLWFRYKPPSDWPEFLNVALKSSQSPDSALSSVTVDSDSVVLAPDGWREVWLDMSELNPQGVPFDRIVISARASVDDDWVLLDKVGLTKPEAGASAIAAPTRGIELGIQCAAASHPISPLIYGSALGDWESGQSAQRIGGNPTSRANWDLGAWNIAKDWFFENTKSADNDTVIEEGLKHGARTAVTVPTIGWVAKDTSSVGFPASKFPGQRKYDPYKPAAGDGYKPDDKPITPGPPTLTSIAAPPELIGKWVSQMRDKDRARSTRGVLMYILDNEPSLWSSTHRDVHPEPLSYDESLDRTLRYATAIRAADPESMIAGPAEWGWLGYMFSARDLVAGKFLRPDRRAHGDEPFIPWYLRRIAEHEKASGVRILDVLDVHYYPAADGVFGDNGRSDADGMAMRLRATRSLWDPEYRDESWIDENIRLIPRLKEWVLANHPGLRISIGEWSFGGEK